MLCRVREWVAWGLRLDKRAMNQVQNIIPRLRQLAELEKTQRQLKESSSAGQSLVVEIESLRELLPTSILAHHDSFRARGKLTIAPVTRGICGACHIALPRGHAAALRRVADDLSVCDNCGVFIYLVDESQGQSDGSSGTMPTGTTKTKPSKRSVRDRVATTRKPLRSP
jgi:predicted  nucleic acid-binding Zn-ribbon protein